MKIMNFRSHAKVGLLSVSADVRLYKMFIIRAPPQTQELESEPECPWWSWHSIELKGRPINQLVIHYFCFVFVLFFLFVFWQWSGSRKELLIQHSTFLNYLFLMIYLFHLHILLNISHYNLYHSFLWKVMWTHGWWWSYGIILCYISPSWAKLTNKIAEAFLQFKQWL